MAIAKAKRLKPTLSQTQRLEQRGNPHPITGKGLSKPLNFGERKLVAMQKKLFRRRKMAKGPGK